VEDSLLVQNRLAEQLTDPGVMRVLASAVSETQAINHIDRLNFDVLVVDIELNPGSGINVIRHARKRWTMAPLPLIIVLTNHTSNAVKDLCMKTGANHFLDKMRQFGQLHSLIRNHEF
jgi:two-component system chemotaxis response regulator CheY